MFLCLFVCVCGCLISVSRFLWAVGAPPRDLPFLGFVLKAKRFSMISIHSAQACFHHSELAARGAAVMLSE